MSYFDAFDYGYDQLYIDPAPETYIDYSNSIIQPTVKNNIHTDNFMASPTIDDDGCPPLRSTPKYNNVYDYLEKTAKSPDISTLGQMSYPQMSSVSNSYKPYIKKHGGTLDNLQEKIKEFQEKHDMFLIFIICLVVFIVIQFGSSSASTVQHMHYIIPMPSNDGSNSGQASNGTVPIGMIPISVAPIK